ncbi:YicC/YloC family endoribonuclease [Veillonella caviae]|uniref:YicC/YloC family endoribonuclease n=1 Tax=Veillonella caviae TaxID=248316 RepID=UPI0023F3512A|nr:YicC/YloC family endoribonuclease [Veillonella caviae]MCI6407753.1 YicC family protein [Veillonella caviae]MDY6225312.1 YicC/YloC family endoribonuclease [Veillonella caviae]
MKSMTGFGRSTQLVDGLQCTIEIKSVNARFLDITIRNPKQLNCVEHIMRSRIQQYLQRGKVDVFVTLDDYSEREKEFTINRVLKEQIQHILVNEGFYHTESQVPLESIMAISSDWIQGKEAAVDEAVLTSLVVTTIDEALESLVSMRTHEGLHLQGDLLNRLSQMEDIVQYIDEHKLVAVENYKLYIENKLVDILAAHTVSINEDRVLQEVALLADKTDITEEIVRFRSHVVQLKNTLMKEGPIGRKLDFIIQEMNREVNTMGSKAMDIALTDRVVQLKCELEKIREQVQNIE